MATSYRLNNSLELVQKGNGTGGVFSTLTNILGQIAAKLKNANARRVKQNIDRQAFAQLLRLNAHILSDIGVTRDDVIWASKLPQSINASLELEKMVLFNKSNLK